MKPTYDEVQKALMRRENAEKLLELSVEKLIVVPNDPKRVRAVQEAAMDVADARSAYAKILTAVTHKEVSHDSI